MDYKLIATDLDGTLLHDKNHKITDNNHIAIKRAIEKGVKVVIISGRCTGSVKDYAKEMNLERTYCGSFNGAVVFDTETLEEKATTYLCKDVFYKLVPYGEGFKEVAFAVYVDNEIYTNNPKHKYIESYNKVIGTKVNSLRDFSNFKYEDKIAKAMFIGDKNYLDEMESLIDNSPIRNDMNYFFSGPKNFEFISKNTGKGNALLDICKLLNISPKETIAIGDNGNDISMIEEAGLGVAVCNGVDQLKEKADFISTIDNNQSAVAEVINKFVLR